MPGGPVPPGAPSRYGARPELNGRHSPASSISHRPPYDGRAGVISPTGSGAGGYSQAANAMPPPQRNGSMGRGPGQKPAVGSAEELEQSRAVARAHYVELYDFLTENGQRAPGLVPCSRSCHARRAS